VDLGTPDPEKIGQFYADLFGWTLSVGPPEAGGYAIAELRGQPVAGIGPQMNPGPPVWATYINVDDADATVKKAKDNGATVIIEPMDVMSVGRMAVLADPAGAVVSLWQAGDHIGAHIVNEPSSYSWSELVTTDVAASKKFYGEVFGWDGQTYGEGDGSYTEFKLGDRSVAGCMPKPPTMPAEIPPHWAVYFSVDDCDKAVERVKELGGSIAMPPMDVEPGRFAVALDPAGAAFNVIKLKPQTTEG
jgi:hypothetical protein